jgi:phenylalanyl-tRNA synthetase beta chain
VRITLDVLADFVDVPPLERLLPTLVAAGIEVEGVDDPAAGARGVVVGRILRVEAHPKAERLQVCTVDDGSEEHTVVCGATNVRADQYIALARVGAQLGDLQIGARSLRGIRSQGMICAREELGLEPGPQEAGKPLIWELPGQPALGTDIWDLLKLAPVLSLGITANRPDLLSHLGVAREVAAATGQRCRPLASRASEKGPEISSLARLVVEDNLACRRYGLRVVSNVRVGPSPNWLVQRLQRLGHRSINNVVDATNYVMLEMGQPLHAFDLARIGVEASLPTVYVRRAREAECLRTLDGTDRSLSANDLVIADATKPLALAGIMGGRESEVTTGTGAVLLEGAYFEPSGIYATARRHGVRSEASLRCERGTDPSQVLKALDRAAQLIADLSGGAVAKGCLEAVSKPDSSGEIILRPRQLPRHLGIELPAETIVQLLEPLDIRCITRTERALIFMPPGFRPDIREEIDLIEEVARRYGYELIPERLPSAAGPCVPAPPAPLTEQPLRLAALAAGLNEVVTEGFGSPTRYAAATPSLPLVRLLNPLGEELSCMRTSLLPGLLLTLQRNQSRGAKQVRLFEMGTIFHGPTDEVDPAEGALVDPLRDQDLPCEARRFACLIYGGRSAGAWYAAGERLDFTDLRGIVENLVDACSAADPLICTPAASAMLHPEVSSRMHLGAIDWGYAGELSPQLLASYDLQGPVYVAELDLDGLAKLPQRDRRYRPLPKFPGIRRDVALVSPRDLPCATLQAFIAAHAGGALGPAVVERVSLFDVYRGKPLQADQVSLGFSIDYRCAARTLTDAEVGEAFSGLLRRLPKQFDVQVRS